MNPEFLNADESKFMFRRLADECPTWAIGVPVLFAFLVVGLIVIFRPEKKLLAAAIGGAIVSVLSVIYLFVGFFLVEHFRWWVILVPIMGVAFFYVGLMYLRDARSVHWLWAIFLGLLRTSVYLILAVVFLMPGCQHFEKQEYESKLIILFDVSESTDTKDDPPEGRDVSLLPTRQDKVLQFFADQGKKEKSFIDGVLAKTRVDMYRFGAVLDEGDVIRLHPPRDKTFAIADATRWLKPNKADMVPPDISKLSDEEGKQKMADFAKRLDMIDLLRSGTNIGGSALQLHKIENNSLIQAIIIISDGQSNLGSEDARADFVNRVNNPKRPIPVFTIGVGQDRVPVMIRIEDVQAPLEVRPDDPFTVRVPVVSTGLQGEEFSVSLYLTRKKDVTGEDVKEKDTIELPALKGVFKGAGDLQQGVVVFPIDLKKLLKDLRGIDVGDDAAGQLEGEWEFRAKTPRHKDEPTKAENVSDPVSVQVQKRKLRVLLFASGATREYQFLRTVLFRETQEKRMEMSICNQQNARDENVDQDVPAERFLSDFPDRIGASDPGKPFMSLSDYDVVVAFDPDWSRLSLDQRAKLYEWVTDHGGGIIFVAGPVHTFQLARPGGQDFSKIAPLYPVVLKDNRLHGLNVTGAGGHDTSKPYPLQFSPVAKEFDFLKLDETGEGPIAGWNGFFYSNEKITEAQTRDAKLRRGFFSYYPVERLKTDSNVAAVFVGPKESRINDKTEAFKDQQPFIVTMRSGSGKTMHVGSGEFWRLRGYKEGFHERLWIKMARHVSSGITQQKKYGKILMARSLPAGKVEFETQIRTKDLDPQPADEPPTFTVKRIDRNRDVGDPGKDKDKKEAKATTAFLKSLPLKARLGEGTWQGLFLGDIVLAEPGEYEFTIPIKDRPPSDYLRQTLIIRKPNPELDNVRTNFGYLYQLASESKGLLDNLPEQSRKEIEAILQVPADQAPADGGKATKRLFFPLSSADAILKCIRQVPPKSDIIKGRFEDLWDDGARTDRHVHAYWAALFAPLVVGVIGVIILLLLRQWLNALVFFGLCVGMTLAVAVIDLVFTNLLVDFLDVNFSYLLLLIVSLLGIEWLARKLLRLA